MNQKNSLGLNKCFLDLDSPFELFQKWFEEAKKKEIYSIVSTAPVSKGKNLLRYVEVYSHHVKDKYYNSIKSNILSKYPQWRYIFEQKQNEMTYGFDSENSCTPSLVSNFRAMSSTINYVQVYDDRCKRKYYNFTLGTK